MNLVKALAPTGIGITVLDNLSAGRAEDLEGFSVALKVGDIRDFEVVKAAMNGMEVVIHLAAQTGVVQSVAQPEMDMAVNVMGTLNLLRAAQQSQVNRFILASTGGAIVGEVEPPVHEEMVPHPISPYGAGKLAAEGYCYAFWGSYGLKTIPLRFSNVYGPCSYHKGSVIAKLFRQIKAKEEITIYGDGEQTRDFVYVEDICRAIVAATRAEFPFGQPIQLGTGRETSINHLVEMMKEVVGPGQFAKVNYAPPQSGEIRRNFVSIQRAREYLKFSPETDLMNGLKQTWKWFNRD